MGGEAGCCGSSRGLVFYWCARTSYVVPGEGITLLKRVEAARGDSPFKRNDVISTQSARGQRIAWGRAQIGLGFMGQNPRMARGNGTPRGRRVGNVPNRPSITTDNGAYF